MPQLTLLGLGPGDPALWTQEAGEGPSQAREILPAHTRTSLRRVPAGPPARPLVRPCLYVAPEFPEIYAEIAREVLALAQKGPVLYAVPGHPLVGETTVRLVLAQARERRPARACGAGPSPFIDAALAALGLDPLDQGLQIADATDLAREHFPRLDTDRPALVGQLYPRAVASDVKLTLLANYPPEHPVTLVHRAGAPGMEVRTLPLSELDRRDEFGLLTTLYLPPAARRGSPQTLGEIMATLRSPEGCPWDREQTPRSLRGALLEETHEVLEALDREDAAALCEELGDLLLHVLFQTQMASEAGRFTLADVGAELAAKLIRRHPHVFGEVAVRNAAEVIDNWNRIKSQEKGNGPARTHWADGIPRHLPAWRERKRCNTKPSVRSIELPDPGDLPGLEALAAALKRKRKGEGSGTGRGCGAVRARRARRRVGR